MCSPRTAISNRSRASRVRMPVVSRYSPIDWLSHSAARLAVHGASSGTCFERRSILHCAKAIVAMASGLIFGMSPV